MSIFIQDLINTDPDFAYRFGFNLMRGIIGGINYSVEDIEVKMFKCLHTKSPPLVKPDLIRRQMTAEKYMQKFVENMDNNVNIYFSMGAIDFLNIHDKMCFDDDLPSAKIVEDRLVEENGGEW